MIVKMSSARLYGTRLERLRSEQPSDEQIAFAFDEVATRSPSTPHIAVAERL
ncbi:hypothetical protein I6F35_29560 [Bradyrhizobium sp. BRP22]|uniref:hypothetical protein n=1 Tax=Bradyrhizobium sp. BRP22 TaxID=2793821 RepID=UPI001CD4AE2C|nr:hypothetical protein [Bradyrhizobium sp. BRP22]MCA1457301.1 hypothetical protein [Bradyrhizobium sp. BRP22]